jgi:parallel beta helix pectate lyase-like protein
VEPSGVFRFGLHFPKGFVMLPSLLLSLAFFTSTPQGATVYVPDDYATIQAALYGVVADDTIIVRPGTYFEYDLDFVGKSITLRSEKGANQTIIDGTASGSVFEFRNAETADAILDGFTVTNGMRWDGGGISIVADANGLPASPTIQNCIIENNVGSGGGGGMAIAGGSTSLIANCLIQNNTTTNYHGAGVVIFSSMPIFRNCTIRENAATGSAGGFSVWNNDSILTLRNCILTGNTPTNIDRVGAPSIRVRYSLSQGDGAESWFGTGCIDADPLFTTGALGDSYLSHIATGQAADSPCIDAGKPSIAAYASTRTDHALDLGIVDIGYHYTDPNPIVLTATGAPGGTMIFKVTGSTPNGPTAFLYSYGTGTYSAPNPYTGNIVTTGLANFGFTLALVVDADAQGDYNLPAFVPAAAAGIVYVQVVDALQDKLTEVLPL